MEHISFERIHSYIEGRINGAEARDVEGHLALCARCNSVFSGIKDMANVLGGAFPVKKGPACPEDWEIAALVRKELESHQSEKIRKHIDGCGACLGKAASYHKAVLPERLTIRASMEWKDMAVRAIAGDSLKKETSFFKGIFESIRIFLSSLPALPGYAVAAASVALLIIWSAMPEGAKITTIASTQRIIFKDVDSSSSFGFMGGEEVKEFKGMEVRRAGKELVFTYKPVSGAKIEDFTLIKKGIGKDAKVITRPVEGAETRIPVDKILLNERYEWIISGRMEDGRRVEAASEFILTR